MTREALTQRQRSILDFVVSFLRERGYPPTLREIGAYFGIKSTNGVSDHLRALERKGYIERSSMLSRGIRPIDEAADVLAAATAERNAYRDAFLKLAPWCDECCDRLATVEVCVDDTDPVYDPRLQPVECCDRCVDRVRLKYPERVVADLSWAAMARKET
jgi:DNA-binding MarR family transcriptional regulator